MSSNYLTMQELDGTTYVAVPETDACKGCAFYDDSTTYCNFNSNNCSTRAIIWVKKTDKNPDVVSVSKVLKAVSIVCDLPGLNRPEMLDKVEAKMKQLDKESDPEFQKYLELKEKFENT